MDLQGITWVGHMYQKFETMCLEVEEVMYQDTIKFVENQVQTVSTNVKRFYSDVLEDLADPSIDEPVKLAVSDKFPKVVSKAEPKKGDVGGVIKNSKQVGIDKKTNQKPSLNQISCTDNMSQPSVVTMEKHFRRESSLSEMPNEKLEGEHNLRTASPVSSEFTGLGLDSVRESCDEINNALSDAQSPRMIGNEETKMALFSSSSSLAESYEQPDERTLDMMSSAVLDMEAAREFDQLDVEESCHIVNGAELPIIPQKEKKNKAYKMRIRDAISSRMRSTREKEYKQLAISFGEHGKSKQVTEDHSRSIICETEWEIL
ncbi:hypothetical protein ACFE04_016403 [Oxalis oulophora]